MVFSDIHTCMCVWCMYAGKQGKVECIRDFCLFPAGDLKVMRTKRWVCSRCQACAPKRGDQQSTWEEAVNVRLDFIRQTPSDFPLLPDSGCTLNSLGRFKLLILKFLLRHDSHNHTQPPLGFPGWLTGWLLTWTSFITADSLVIKNSDRRGNHFHCCVGRIAQSR